MSCIQARKPAVPGLHLLSALGRGGRRRPQRRLCVRLYVTVYLFHNPKGSGRPDRHQSQSQSPGHAMRHTSVQFDRSDRSARGSWYILHLLGCKHKTRGDVSPQVYPGRSVSQQIDHASSLSRRLLDACFLTLSHLSKTSTSLPGSPVLATVVSAPFRTVPTSSFPGEVEMVTPLTRHFHQQGLHVCKSSTMESSQPLLLQ